MSKSEGATPSEDIEDDEKEGSSNDADSSGGGSGDCDVKRQDETEGEEKDGGGDGMLVFGNSGDVVIIAGLLVVAVASWYMWTRFG